MADRYGRFNVRENIDRFVGARRIHIPVVAKVEPKLPNYSDTIDLD